MALARMRGRGRTRRIALAVTCAGFLAGCDGAGGGGACTEEFAILAVRVLQPDGAPLDSAVVSSILVRTGERLPVITLGMLEPGAYPVVDDGSLQKLRASGDVVRFAAQAGPLAATADFTIASRDGCHVSKVAGPDTVWAAYLPD
jgi:hypothetical protein